MMMKGFRIPIVLLLFPILALFAQDSGGSPVPETLLRPQYGETPQFPLDYAIGELGRGDAPEEAYQSARFLSAGLFRGDSSARGAVPEDDWNRIQESISALGPRIFRIGGGRTEADGSVSFLIRFIGREQAIKGELYLRRVNSGQEAADAETGAPSYVWQAEDLLLEEPALLTMGKYGPGSQDMTVYERFF
jgi:hypothetical protein